MDFVSKNSFALICYVCMKKFENKYRLEDHMNIHDQGNPYFCKVCDKGFTNKYTYERHVLQNHEEDEGHYACKECNASFTFKREQRNIATRQKIGIGVAFVRKHSLEKIISCSIKEFNTTLM